MTAPDVYDMVGQIGLDGAELSGPDGPVLHVAGADLMDGTPIFDIKPYIPYADCHPEATGGFTDAIEIVPLAVDFPPALLERIPPEFLPNAHHWILLHGRYICTARKPHCEECPLSTICNES